MSCRFHPDKLKKLTSIPGPLANHAAMVAKFEAVMAKMAVLGHNPNTLIDCSEVIPVPAVGKSNTATFPAGQNRADVQVAVCLLVLVLVVVELLIDEDLCSARQLPSRLSVLILARLLPSPPCKSSCLIL